MTRRRYGIVRHVPIRDWRDHEAFHRAEIVTSAIKGAADGDYTPPPEDPAATIATPYRWEPMQPDAPVMDCPLDVAEFIELRLTWADPEDTQ